MVARRSCSAEESVFKAVDGVFIADASQISSSAPISLFLLIFCFAKYRGSGLVSLSSSIGCHYPYDKESHCYRQSASDGRVQQHTG
ncbi:hypothetical protein [Oceanimonas doudoroffii]|uniref:hypothetical protein n=1 Tax=Oceanimonas doudoroffii TaxID=84158 RepID=UPI00146AA996|nr:hypothetical protein [Oceanimonas doudoroffii]